MQSAERALIPYRLRTVRVGIQGTTLLLLLFIVVRLLPGAAPVSWMVLGSLLGVSAAGTFAALFLPWQRLFESGWGLKLLYAWSVADILLISVALALTHMDYPNLFLLYALTTVFFAATYPVGTQASLYGLTLVAYLTVRSLVGFEESMPETIFKLGSLGLIAFLASFLSRELMQQMMRVTAGRVEVEGEKRFYEMVLQAQSDMEEGLSIVDIESNRIVYVNDAICRMLGYSREELVGMDGMSNMELLPPEEREFVEDLRRERAETNSPLDYHQDFRLITKDGREITVETVSKPLDEKRIVSLTRDVTEERRAEKRLRDRQELFSAASELSRGFVYSLKVDPNGSLIGEWATAGFSKMSGVPRDEEASRRWTDYIYADDLPTAQAALMRLFKGAESIAIPLRVVGKDGEVRFVETYGKAVWNEDRTRVVRIYGMVQDITEQHRAEAALQGRSDLLRAISQLGSDFAFSVAVGDDASLRYEWVTGAVEGVTGYRFDESDSIGWAELIHPEDHDVAADAFKELLSGTTESVVSEVRLVRKSGEVRDIRARTRGEWDPASRRLIRFFGSVEDITDTKKAEAALKESEERYRSLFDRLPIGLFLRTPGGIGLDANRACIELFRYPDKETFLKTSAEEFYVDRTDRKRWLEGIESDSSSPFEVEFRRYDGSTFWGRQTARAVRDADGGVIFFEGAIEDVSLRRDMEQERESSLSLLRATLESSWDGLLVVDLQGRIVEFNEHFADMWEIPREVLDSRDDERAMGWVLEQLKDAEGFVARVQELYRAPEEESFDVIEFKDGRVFERFSRPQRVDDRVMGRVWSFRDISERMELQAQLLQAQKMEAVGRLAGGVAHDFNNLLTAMLGYCELILTSPDAPEATRRDVEEIEQAAQMGADIAAQLLDLSRRKVLRPEVLDVNEIVTSMLPMLKRLAGDDVIVETELSSRQCMIEADRSQIEQVVLNLVVNARDAMVRGGEIHVATSNVEISEELASRNLQLSPGRHALLNVTDTGHGIDPEIKDRIFEPFFTTRTGSRGTGLGLSTVYGIVSHYHGHVTVDSEPGKGTSFRVYLPESVREPIPMARARAASKWLSGDETVLLVEDDPSVRRLARRAMEKYGYSLLEASNGSEALRLVGDPSTRIDIMITDVIMPGMDGRQLADKLLPDRPDLRILYMSGYTGEALARFGDLRKNEDFIPKPFRPDELVARARELLNRGSGRAARAAD